MAAAAKECGGGELSSQSYTVCCPVQSIGMEECTHLVDQTLPNSHRAAVAEEC